MKTWSEVITFVILTISTFAFDSHQSPAHVTRFRKIPAEDVVFDGAAKDFVSGSRTRCAMACIPRTQCLSYSFQKSSGRCLVFNRRVIYGIQMTSATGFQHYWKVTDHCPTTQGFYVVEGSCVKVHETQVTWLDAESTCETEGAHLFAGQTEREMYVAESVVNSRGSATRNYRFGAWDHDKNGTWFWVTGLKVLSSAWPGGAPNGSKGKICAESAIYNAKQITANRCTNLNPFVCHVIVGQW